MALSLVTAPTCEPLDIEDVKSHLRVDVNDEDDLIAGLISAATQHVESYTHRALISQTWDDTRDEFPCWMDDGWWLPKPPVSSVVSIAYLDNVGVTQTWASDQYVIDLPTGPWARRARITPAYNVSYPFTRSLLNAVTVRFVCGYGVSGTSVPAPILQAMKLLIGHWYAQRESVNIGNIVSVIPQAVDSLLWPFKAF